MIIKSLTWKSAKTPYPLLNYIFSGIDKLIRGQVFYHNIRVPSFSGAMDQFREQMRYLKKRINGITFYHIIISASPEDSKNPLFTQEVFEDLALKYIKLRGAENAVILGAVHNEKNRHFHLIISSNEYKSKQNIRIDKSRFIELRREFEEYQLSKYPFLDKSIVYIDKELKQQRDIETEDKNKRKRNFDDMKRRIEKVVMKCFKASNTKDEFTDRLLQNQHEIYRRKSGSPCGVLIGDKQEKLRFDKCGISAQMFKDMEGYEIDIYEKRRKELEILSSSSNKKIDKNLGINL